MYSKTIKIADIFSSYKNPIAQIVQNACTFESEIYARVLDHRINLKSIMGIMACDWSEGTEVEVDAVGSDAEEAVTAICHYLQCKS